MRHYWSGRTALNRRLLMSSLGRMLLKVAVLGILVSALPVSHSLSVIAPAPVPTAATLDADQRSVTALLSANAQTRVTQAIAQPDVLAWGGNYRGQLGFGTITDTVTPTVVPTLTNIIDVATGGHHSLALKADGTVWAWGYNYNGELGTVTEEQCGVGDPRPCSTVPVQISELSGVIAIAAGGYHSLALKADGTVWAWGFNSRGQLGTNTMRNSGTPLHVSTLTEVIAITAGDFHSLALKADGTVWAWGLNNYGQLGVATTDTCPNVPCSKIPLQVQNLEDVVVITSGSVADLGAHHSLALKTDGTVWAWGLNDKGQLGNNTKVNSQVPIQVHNLSGITAIASGAYHSLTVKADGTVWVWGDNSNGELGTGTTTGSTIPIPVSDFEGAVSVAGGLGYSLAVRTDGTVWAWGRHQLQTGASTVVSSTIPLQMSNLTNVTTISAGTFHSLALGHSNTPLPTSTPTPTAISTNTPIATATATNIATSTPTSTPPVPGATPSPSPTATLPPNSATLRVSVTIPDAPSAIDGEQALRLQILSGGSPVANATIRRSGSDEVIGATNDKGVLFTTYDSQSSPQEGNFAPSFIARLPNDKEVSTLFPYTVTRTSFAPDKTLTSTDAYWVGLAMLIQAQIGEPPEPEVDTKIIRIPSGALANALSVISLLLNIFEVRQTYDPQTGDVVQQSIYRYSATQPGVSDLYRYVLLIRRNGGVVYGGSIFSSSLNGLPGMGFGVVIGHLASPADLVLTDPQARIIGIDPETGQYVNQIPHAYYLGPNTEPELIVIFEPMPGNYKVTATGTGTGTIHLDVGGITASGEAIRTSRVLEITSGQQVSEQFSTSTTNALYLPLVRR